MSLGERFRAAREQRGLTLSEVAEHLRIRSVYLSAIEDENWAAIGAPVYTRGFLRTYARYLNLDPEQAVADFNACAGVPASVTPSQYLGSPARTQSPASLRWVLWLSGAVAAALVGFVIYLYLTPPTRPTVTAQNEATVAASPAASPSRAIATPEPAAAPHTLSLSLTQASWLRVSVDGSVSIEGTFPAGTHKTFHGSVALLRVGNAGGVQVSVDGRPVGKLGAAGDVVEKTFTL